MTGLVIHARATWVEPSHPVTGPAAKRELVEAVVYHYPGSSARPPASFAELVGLARAMHRSYLTSRGYSLGYCYLIGPAGDVLEVRGVDIRNAANNGVESKSGVPNYNPFTVSVQFVVQGPAPATAAQLASAAALHRWLETQFYRRRLRVEGHGDKDATPCPGAGIAAQLPELERLIRSGLADVDPQPEPPPPPPPPNPLEDTMATLLVKGPDGSLWVVAPDLSSRVGIWAEDYAALEAAGAVEVALRADTLERIPGAKFVDDQTP